jgi:aminoglycoside phosphotransferase (APT) family kinase protein
MKSIDTPLVRRLIATQFPHWEGLFVTPVLPGGWDNSTFRLGKTMSVRLPNAQRYVSQVAKEHEWLPKLAPHLPFPIPSPIAQGKPGEGYPWPWSICRWIEGNPVQQDSTTNLAHLATDLARFLTALHKIDPAGGPIAGAHNFHRGGSLRVYDEETRNSIAMLATEIDANAAIRLWETALSTGWRNPPVWVHGDIAIGNLLVRNNRLAAVIDFGNSGIGDPACDLVMAWTYFDANNRAAFRATLPHLDAATWARGRGWALWKALITLAPQHGTISPKEIESAHQTIRAALTDND